MSPRLLGFLSLLGTLFFLASLTLLHIIRTDIDWTAHYVSDFANGPYGFLFLVAVLVHGAGNLALAAGLFKCLGSHSFRDWASVLFGAAAAVLFGTAALGIFVVGIFPIDPSGIPSSQVGFIHEAATAVSFPLELAAFFLFSLAFSRSSGWRMRETLSFTLSILATIGLSIFFATVLIDWMPGLGERIALASFFPWELWVAWRLARKPIIEGADGNSGSAEGQVEIGGMIEGEHYEQ